MGFLKSMMDVASATDAVDLATARRSLPVAFLMERYGHSVQVDGARIKAFCPFHKNENTEAWSAFGEGLSHWSCWSCGAKGDATDLLKGFEPELVGLEAGTPFSTIAEAKPTAALFNRIRELITEVIDSGWDGPSGANVQATPFNIHEAQEIVDISQTEPNYARIADFVKYKREQRGNEAWPYSPEYLVDEWDVGTYNTWMIIPYYDEDSGLVAYKRWTEPDKLRYSVKGSGIWDGHLYGDHRPDDGRPILLCEGESDAWFAHFHVGTSFRVLSLPTGVQSSMTAAERLAGRTVFLGFDGDGTIDGDGTKGRGATMRWADKLESLGCSVRILPVDEGKDLSTSGDLHRLIADARSFVRPMGGLIETGSGYVRHNKQGEANPISNWVFIPERSLRGDDLFAWEGRLSPGNVPAVITSLDMETDGKLTKWAAKYGRTWLGNSTDARTLMGNIQAKDVFLPSGRLVTMAGLHEDTFVWPGGRLGPDQITYVPPGLDSNLKEFLKIEPGAWGPEIVHMMRAIQKNSTIDPLMAWMAAAPLRARYSAFPFVGARGHFGTGKTQTVLLLMKAFAGSSVQRTFMGTPLSIEGAFAATNADIANFDEYTARSRKDSREAFEQLGREAYTGTVHMKGGSGANWQAQTVINTMTPVIVTGESMLTEGSHVERMIPIRVEKDGRNAAAFEALHEYVKTHTGFAYGYRAWLSEKILDGSIPKRIDIQPMGPFDLATRQRHNIGVIHYGWSLLQGFMADHNDHLDEPDFSFVLSDQREANKHTPIEEAINFCIGEPEAGYFCKFNRAEKTIWIQVDGFVMYLEHPLRKEHFKLAGNKQSVRDYLIDKLDGQIVAKDMREGVEIQYSKLAR